MEIIIAGSRWKTLKLTPKHTLAIFKKMGIKGLGEHVSLSGFCDWNEKIIYVREKQHPEDKQNTQLHEGLHAILSEIGPAHGINGLACNEAFISSLTQEVLGYLKQIGVL